MSIYRKKPIDIEARRMPLNCDQDAVEEIAHWMVDRGYRAREELDAGAPLDLELYEPMYIHDGHLTPEYASNWMEIETLEGAMSVGLGDWVIQGVEGEFYPCKDSIFTATYEVVSK